MQGLCTRDSYLEPSFDARRLAVRAASGRPHEPIRVAKGLVAAEQLDRWDIRLGIFLAFL